MANQPDANSSTGVDNFFAGMDDGTQTIQPAPSVAPVTDDTHVEIDGQRLTLSELKSGYLRQKDYTRKTQEISDVRKRYDA